MKLSAPRIACRQRSRLLYPPCRPIVVGKPPAGPGWAHELKHDGYRLQIHVRDTRVRLYTMHGADWSKRYPRIVEDTGPRASKAVLLHSSGSGTDHLTVRSLNEHHQLQGLVMGLFTKDIESMDDLFLHGLMDIYYAEKQIIQSLPKLIEKATSRDLSKGLKDHLLETKNQVERLEQVFRKLGKKPKGVQCQAIDGLIDEADEIVGEVADKDVLDAAIVGSAQAVEHYEIARYGTLIAWADSLGHDDIIRLLNTNLNEEKAADKKLSTVALRKGVNRKAAS